MGTKLNRVDIAIVEYNGHIYILQQYLHLCTSEVRSEFTGPCVVMCRLSELHYPECTRHTGCRRDSYMMEVAPVKFEQNPHWPCESSILKCTTRHNRPVFAFRFDMILISLKLLLRCLWILHTSLQLNALIRSWRGVYICRFRCVQFKNKCTAKNTLAV